MWFVLAALAVVLAAAVGIYAGLKINDGPEDKVVLVAADKAGERMKVPADQDFADQLKVVLARIAEQPEGSAGIAVSYATAAEQEDRRGLVVVVAAVEAPIGDPQTTVSQVTERFRIESEMLRDVVTVSPGSLGGAIRCGWIDGGDHDGGDFDTWQTPVCVWADTHTVGVVIFAPRHITAAQAKSEVLIIRAAVEQRV